MNGIVMGLILAEKSYSAVGGEMLVDIETEDILVDIETEDIEVSVETEDVEV